MARKNIKRFGDANQHFGRPPDGQSSGGMFNIAFAAALGEMIAYWPHIEDRMIIVLRSLIGNHEQQIPSQQIFRAVVSQDARIKMMRAILEQSPINQKKGAIFDAMIDEFEALNKARNKYVHGLWWTHESQRMYLQPASTSEAGFLDQREVTLQEMNEVLERMGNLWRRVTAVLMLGNIGPPTGPTRPV